MRRLRAGTREWGCLDVQTATGLRVEYVSKPTDIDTERDRYAFPPFPTGPSP